MGVVLNAPLPPEHLLRPGEPEPQAAPVPAAAAVRRYQWQGRYGTMCVEVVGETLYVNGQRVEPAPPR